MGIKYIRNLPSPEEIIDKYPLSKELEAKKKEFDREIADVITGNSKKFLAVIGPCLQTMRIPYLIMQVDLQKWRRKSRIK